MNKNQVEQIYSAMESAGIEEYTFVLDTPTMFRNNKYSFVKFISDKELLLNVRTPIISENKYSDNGVEVLAADVVDVHELRAICTDSDKIKTFLESLGATLEDKDIEIIGEINGRNVELEPVTGDYVTFKFLPEEQYNNLDDDKKAIYDEMAKFEMKPLVNFYVYTEKLMEVNNFTAADKAKYNELLEKYNVVKDKYIAPHQAAQISFK